jgi:hypothetical protein
MLRIRFSGLYGLEIDDAAVAAGTPGREPRDGDRPSYRAEPFL